MHKPLLFLIVGQNRNEIGFLCRMLEIMGFEASKTSGILQSGDFLYDPDEKYPDWIITVDSFAQFLGLDSWLIEKNGHPVKRIPIVHLESEGESPTAVADRIQADSGEQPLRNRVGALLLSPPFAGRISPAERIIYSLALDIDSKDPYTMGHSGRISRHSANVAGRLGLSEGEIHVIRRGGLLHDIGKIGIPTDVLKKPGSLSETEIERIRQHPVTGEKICKPLTSLLSSLPIIRHHHERMNGRGYPDGLSGDRIPVGARIVGAVDFLDALLTERPYSKAETIDLAMAMLQKEADNGHLDPDVVSVIIEYINEIGDTWVSE